MHASGFTSSMTACLQNFRFLATLRLRCIVSLTPDVDHNLTVFAAQNAIDLVHIKVERSASNFSLKPEHVQQFLACCTQVRTIRHSASRDGS